MAADSGFAVTVMVALLGPAMAVGAAGLAGGAGYAAGAIFVTLFEPLLAV